MPLDYDKYTINIRSLSVSLFVYRPVLCQDARDFRRGCDQYYDHHNKYFFLCVLLLSLQFIDKIITSMLENSHVTFKPRRCSESHVLSTLIHPNFFTIIKWENKHGCWTIQRKRTAGKEANSCMYICLFLFFCWSTFIPEIV